jgi:hypothetical protein
MAMKNIDTDDFRLRPGKSVELDKWPTKGKPVAGSTKEYEKLLAEHIQRLSDRQKTCCTLPTATRYC